MSDGETVPHPIESEILKYIFEKHNEYCEHPPQDLVEEVIGLYKSRAEKITYEEAEKKVSLEAIRQRIADEVNEKWGDYLKGQKAEKLAFVPPSSKVEFKNQTESIIGEEEWEKVKAIICKEETPEDELPIDNMKL